MAISSPTPLGGEGKFFSKLKNREEFLKEDYMKKGREKERKEEKKE